MIYVTRCEESLHGWEVEVRITALTLLRSPLAWLQGVETKLRQAVMEGSISGYFSYVPGHWDYIAITIYGLGPVPAGFSEGHAEGLKKLLPAVNGEENGS